MISDEQEYMKWIERAAKAGNSNALRLLAQIKGMIQEKQKDEHDFDPEEYAAIAQRLVVLQREDYKKANRICPVCGGPSALSRGLCVDTGRGAAEGSEVGSVAVPVRPSDGLPDSEGVGDTQVPADRDNVADSRLLPVDDDIPF